MNNFKSATVILPVMNETYSLKQTVKIIRESSDGDVKEYIIVVCDRTTKESLMVCDELRKELGDRVIIHWQKMPFIGGALREAFDLARGSHVILMASDLETPPEVVKDLINEAKKNPDMITPASRWIKGGGFEGYNPVKFISNYIFQKAFSILYGVNLTDMTYAYRIFPTELVQSIRWEELRHPFLLETIIKPLRLGVRAKEIPAKWKARTEGESQNTFFRNFSYFKIGWRTRFMSKEQILKKGLQ